MRNILFLFAVLSYSARVRPVGAQCQSAGTCTGGATDNSCCSEATNGGSGLHTCCGSGTCTPLFTISNCASCGTTCTSGTQPGCCPALISHSSGSGSGGTAAVYGTTRCTDLTTDDGSCLACNNECTGGTHCCPATSGSAAGCTDQTTSFYNCGGCAHTCDSTGASQCFNSVCVCLAGYSGSLCQTNINECASSPCGSNGQCVDGMNSYACTCNAGFTGKRCQTDINECASSPCGSHGVCVDLVNGYRCSCLFGYTGTTCQTKASTSCSSSPCTNGATCHDDIDNGFLCVCPSGFAGSTCQANSTTGQCASNQCSGSQFCMSTVQANVCPHTSTVVAASSSHRSMAAVGNGIVYLPCTGCSTHEGYNIASGAISIPLGTIGTPRFNFWSTPLPSGIGYLIFGGSDGGGASVGAVEQYTVSTGTFSTVFQTTVPRSIGTFGTDFSGNFLVFAGGASSTSGVSALTDIYDYDANLWRTATLSVARDGMGSAASPNGLLWFPGGNSASAASAVVDILDLSSLAYLTPSTLSLARQLPAACSLGSTVYVGGGGSFDGNTFYSTLDKFDIYSRTRIAVSNLPRPRFLGFCAGFSDTVVFASGYTTGSVLTTIVDVYVVETDSWSLGQPLAVGKFGNAAVQYPSSTGALFILGPSNFATVTRNVDVVNMTCYSCVSSPCLNGGSYSGSVCTCVVGYTGAFCQIRQTCTSAYSGGTGGIPFVINYRYATATPVYQTAGFSSFSSCYFGAAANPTTRYVTFVSPNLCKGYSTIDNTTILFSPGTFTASVDVNAVLGNLTQGTTRDVLCDVAFPQSYAKVPAGNQTCVGTQFTGGATPPCVACSPPCIQGMCTYAGNSSAPGVCLCTLGWTGAYCQTNVNECASTPCQNGATCADRTNSFVCTCTPGYTGPLCQTDVNECASNPCMNGASCSDMINSFLCACPSGYSGTLCSTDINECASAPCTNNGTCVDAVNSYTCNCVPPFGGVRCQLATSVCASIPCQNGATCMEVQPGVVTCQCVPGYSGGFCQTDINECATSPCPAGSTCIDGVNTYSCTCPVVAGGATSCPGPLKCCGGVCSAFSAGQTQCPATITACNVSEITGMCGAYATGCMKTTTGLSTSLVNCSCVANRTFPVNPMACGFNFTVDICHTGQATKVTETSACGVFAVSSSRVCPFSQPVHLDQCVDSCICRNGTGAMPGSLVQCGGQDIPCSAQEVALQCGPGYVGCTKRCAYPSTEFGYAQTDQCTILAETCKPGFTTQVCSNSELVACGPATAKCVTTMYAGVNVSNACTCTPTGFSTPTFVCEEWEAYDYSDISTAPSSDPNSCFQQCGPALIRGNRNSSSLNWRFSVFDQGASWLRGGNNCAKRRFFVPSGLGSLSLTSLGSVPYGPSLMNGGSTDLQFQWLVTHGLVAWNGTGHSNVMTVIRSLSPVVPFYVRVCDCHAPLLLASQTTVSVPFVYTTFAGVTTTGTAPSMPSALVSACRAIYYNYLTSSGTLDSVSLFNFSSAIVNSQSGATCSSRGLVVPSMAVTQLVAASAVVAPVQSLGGFGFPPLARTGSGGEYQLCSNLTMLFAPGTIATALRNLGSSAIQSGQSNTFAFSMWVYFLGGDDGSIAQIRDSIGSPCKVGLEGGRYVIGYGSKLVDSSFAEIGKWTFLAVVYEERNSLTLYVNGVQRLSGTPTDPPNAAPGTNAWQSIVLGDTATNCRIAFYRFYSQNEPTPSQIVAEYTTGTLYTTGGLPVSIFFSFGVDISGGISPGGVLDTNHGTMSGVLLKLTSGSPIRSSNLCLVSYQSSACACNPGWTGASCEVQTCCSMNLGGVAGGPSCDDGFQPAPACAQWFNAAARSATWNANNGSFGCDYGQVCNEASLNKLSGALCGSLGSLEDDPSIASTPGCACYPNPTSVYSSSTCPSVVCSNHGTSAFNPSTGVVECTCQPGWKGSDCAQPILCPGPSGGVNSVGQCPTVNGVVVNVDSVVFNATHCTRICVETGFGFWSDPCCSTWNPIALTTCTVNTPYALAPTTVVTTFPLSGLTLVYSDIKQCQCKNNATGASCSVASCPTSNGLVCSGRGTCSQGVCSCLPQWTGCACQYDFYALCTKNGGNCTTDLDPTGSGCLECSNSGTCDSSYTSGAISRVCTCATTFTGSACQTAKCPNNCNFGTSGGRCSTSVPGNFTNPVCQCPTSGSCSPDPGTRIYAGADCSTDVCASCGWDPVSARAYPNGVSYTVCNGHGTCVSGACVCDAGYTGTYCQGAPCTGACNPLPTSTYCVPDSGSGTCPCFAGFTKVSGNCVSLCGPRSVPIPNPTNTNYYCQCLNGTTYDNSTCKSTDATLKASCCQGAACPVDSSGVTCGAPISPPVQNSGSPYCRNGTCVCTDYAIQPNVFAYSLSVSGYCIPYCNPLATTNMPCHTTPVTDANPLHGVCTSCACATGYTTQSRCYSSVCLNGGTLTPSGTSCICAVGWSGATCSTAVCDGLGTLDSTGLSCICTFPYVASGTNCVSGCLNGGVVLNGACSCPFAWNGTNCQTPACGPNGFVSNGGASCSCNNFFSGARCDVSLCQNGGTYNAGSGLCVCDVDHFGTLCQFRTCGVNGRYNQTTSSCVCSGTALALNSTANNCTLSLCGRFGSPNTTTGLTCSCGVHTALVTVLPPYHPVACEPQCSHNGTFNYTSIGCDCPDPAFSAPPFCSASPRPSSTALSVPSSSASPLHPSSSSGSHNTSSTARFSSTGAALVPITVSPTPVVVVFTTANAEGKTLIVAGVIGPFSQVLSLLFLIL